MVQKFKGSIAQISKFQFQMTLDNNKEQVFFQNTSVKYKLEVFLSIKKRLPF